MNRRQGLSIIRPYGWPNKLSRETQIGQCFGGREEGEKSSYLNIYNFIVKPSVHSLLACFLVSEFEKQSLVPIDLVISSVLSNEMLATIHLMYAKSLTLTKISQRIQMNKFFCCFKELDCSLSQLHRALRLNRLWQATLFLLKKLSGGKIQQT